MIVIKFGGSAVKDAPAMQKVIDWVKGEVAKGSMPVVVVSALALVTNHLTEVSELIRDGKLAAAHHLLNSIARRHDYMALSLWLHMGNRLRNEFERLKSVVLNGNFPRFMDEVLAAGELASSQLLTEVLCRVGLQSQWIDAREVIITDDKHTEANPDWDATQERARAIILPVVKRGIVPVIGGFIGSTGDGVTTTIGREGSDLTATLLGACPGRRRVR
ncbi:MAG: Aspartokinase [Candidatus Gottesmanbacteria bacterium GW2011_GWA2_47_9]|uniref:Aspartokinase n=1 Tax=Candidatus Gottesmanbacteria bacterium GW2011_GWA2_47_9 TaxID=1618445 RepID=A0A0G1W7Z8_9BACT|nr:MAG: Aspartokinase [Candidatus Gottesmanbacteria bacterium GW2011_GWA2_47_9]